MFQARNIVTEEFEQKILAQLPAPIEIVQAGLEKGPRGDLDQFCAAINIVNAHLRDSKKELYRGQQDFYYDEKENDAIINAFTAAIEVRRARITAQANELCAAGLNGESKAVPEYDIDTFEHDIYFILHPKTQVTLIQTTQACEDEYLNMALLLAKHNHPKLNWLQIHAIQLGELTRTKIGSDTFIAAMKQGSILAAREYIEYTALKVLDEKELELPDYVYGDPHCLRLMGGWSRDKETAVNCLKQAVCVGSGDAGYHLFTDYIEGRNGLIPESELIRTYLELAVGNHCYRGFHDLAELFWTGNYDFHHNIPMARRFAELTLKYPAEYDQDFDTAIQLVNPSKPKPRMVKPALMIWQDITAKPSSPDDSDDLDSPNHSVCSAPM